MQLLWKLKRMVESEKGFNILRKGPCERPCGPKSQPWTLVNLRSALAFGFKCFVSQIEITIAKTCGLLITSTSWYI